MDLFTLSSHVILFTSSTMHLNKSKNVLICYFTSKSNKCTTTTTSYFHSWICFSVVMISGQLNIQPIICMTFNSTPKVSKWMTFLSMLVETTLFLRDSEAEEADERHPRLLSLSNLTDMTPVSYHRDVRCYPLSPHSTAPVISVETFLPAQWKVRARLASTVITFW